MDSTTRNVVTGIVVVVIIALLGYFAWHQHAAMTGSTATSTSSSLTTASSTSSTSTPGYTVKIIPSTNSTTPPNYAAPLAFSDTSLTADEQTQLQAQFAQTTAAIKANPTDLGSWVTLGTIRKEAGDYAGASADWTYATQIYPTDPTAYADLGDLYANYLKEPSQGIAYYRDAIKRDPTQEVTFYENLAQIYLNENDTADAKAVLEQGITANVVGYPNLQAELNSIQ
jgi:tetratricopeptide (TPR) repeat protein